MEPYFITIEGTLPDDTDFEADGEKIIKTIAVDLEKTGHAISRVSISHGAIRGGSRTLTKDDLAAPAEALTASDVATVTVSQAEAVAAQG